MLLIADFPSKPQRKVSLLDVQSALGASKPTATREQKKGGGEGELDEGLVDFPVRASARPNPKLQETRLKSDGADPKVLQSGDSGVESGAGVADP